MTTCFKTVTDHLLEAQGVLDDDELAPRERLSRALACLERALDAIQLARAEVCAALDKF